MSPKYKIIISLVALLVAFAFGRYSAHVPPNTKTAETKTTNTQEKADQEKHIVTVIQKDCKTGKETTTITEDDKSHEEEVQKTVAELVKIVDQNKRRTINISTLVGVDVINAFKPSYGLSIDKEVLGPITLGVYGLTSGGGTVGFRAGVNF